MQNKITAVIPVRAGSKRLPNKNILPFGDSNLLIHKIRQLKQVKGVDTIVVSSDSPEMLNMAYSESAGGQNTVIDRDLALLANIFLPTIFVFEGRRI